MLNINTNLSSLIAQNSLKQSTNKLNTAIERMSTGCKINHAKDNAANYSISTNMTTKIGAYQVAEDNALQGLDMINTASESLTLIEDKLMRLRALAEQSANGTYGAQSKQSINQEANAIVDEINRIYSTAEYNGISIYDSAKGAGCDLESLPEAGASGFIKEVKRRDTSSMKKLEDVAIDQALTSGTYSISTADELAKLATMTNNGLIGENTEFVLANDIDLSGIAWVPIGAFAMNKELSFQGTFDGNGYIISNLTSASYISGQTATGLFGNTYNAIIKNLGVTDANTNTLGLRSGVLVGDAKKNTNIDNCYAVGNVRASTNSGGLVGRLVQNSQIKNSYADVDIEVISQSHQMANFGGLIGANEGVIINCFAIGDVTGCDEAFNLGGLVGCSSALISNSYATGNVSGEHSIGGLVGWLPGDEFSQIGLVENCYAGGNVTLNGIFSTGILARAGGLFGSAKETTIKNCTSSSVVTTALADSYELYALGGAKSSQAILYNGVEIQNCLYDSTVNTGITISSENVALSNVYDSSTTTGVVNIGLQVGISSIDSSQVNLTSSFKLDGIYSLKNIGLSDSDYLSIIDEMLSQVSEKQTEYGAVQNRLESVVEEIGIQYDNLVSSRSTLRDADIAEVSAEYIQQQILQQASATLLATANQSPAIALQLI